MKKLYLITGASGHLGNVLLQRILLNAKNNEIDIRVLKLYEDGTTFDKKVDVFCGDISKKETLNNFFEFYNYDEVCLIHCASMVSISSFDYKKLEMINVLGTKNIMELALDKKIDKVVYVSSVHALREESNFEIISEQDLFSDEWVVGDYAKTKALASQVVTDYKNKGLNISIVHPSGIIGAGDINNTNNTNKLVREAINSNFFFYTKGGYDFVDVEDVVDGILKCEEKYGENYILSGEYIKIEDIGKIVKNYKNKKMKMIYIPLILAKIVSYVCEAYSYITKTKPIFTPYAIYTLNSNANFSNQKARDELEYNPRRIKEGIINYIRSIE